MIARSREKERYNDAVLRHAGKNLSEVMADVFEQYPEESFYFLNEGRLRDTARLFQENFLPDDERRRIAYALKANSHPEVLRILSDAGIEAFDCASVEEIELVKGYNDKSEPFYNNPNKTRREIRNAAGFGVRHFTADFNGEVDKILSVCENFTPEVAIRMAMDNAEGAVVNLSGEGKFGATEEEAKTLLKKIDKLGGLPCASINMGSQVLDSNSYERGIVNLVKMVKDSVGKVLSVNFGGGMPVLYGYPYEQNAQHLINGLKNLSESIRNHLGNILEDEDSAKIIIEPGRSMVAPSIDLAAYIINAKKKSLVVADGIYQSFGGVLVHPEFAGVPMGAVDAKGLQFDGRYEDVILDGSSCDTSDRIVKGPRLPEGLREGDYLHVANAGAYTSIQSTNFHARKKHRYVVYNF